MPFDPCREWLGIDAVDLGDPHRVLDIPVSLTDPAAIAAAAEARLATLRRINPGPFARAHAALMERVAEARQTLLDRLPATPPPPVLQAALPQALNPGPMSEPLTPPPGVAPAADADGFTLPASTTSALRPVRRRRSSSGDDLTGLLLGLGALLAAAAAVIAFFVMQGPTKSGPGRQVAVAPPVATTSSTTKAAEPAAKAEPVEERTPKPKPAAKPKPGPTPKPTPPPPPPPPVDPSVDENADRMDAEEAGRTAAEQREREQQQARMQEQVDAALREAYAALQRREFDTADRAIAAAGRQVGDDVEAATRIECWRLLATYARNFVSYREQAFKAANAGREYDLGDTRFAVIEITPEKFVYRLRGKIERTTPDAVDPRIALAIVEAWFAADGRAANHLFLGAQAFCLDPPDLRRARGEWQRAGQGGEQAAPLLALLDDPVIRRAGGR